MTYAGMIKKAPDDESEASKSYFFVRHFTRMLRSCSAFSATPATATKPQSALRRAGTVMRPDKKDRNRDPDGDLLAHEVYCFSRNKGLIPSYHNSQFRH